MSERSIVDVAVEAAAPSIVGGPPVLCTECKKPKHPVGRDPGVYAASGYCQYECPGRSLPPHPGNLWPGETLQDFGYPTEAVERELRDQAIARASALAALLELAKRHPEIAPLISAELEPKQHACDCMCSDGAEEKFCTCDDELTP